MDGPLAPALLEGLLLAPGTAAARRDQSRAPHADLAGPLLVPAGSTASLQEQLIGADHGLRLVLVADADGLEGLRAARNLLLDDDRVELTGVHVALPAGIPAAALLAELDFTVPAWVEVPPTQGWAAALEAIAADGAERLAVRLPPRGSDAGAHEPVAALVRRAVDLGLALRVTGSGGSAVSTPQATAALSAVAAARDGAPAADIAAALASTSVATSTAVLRALGDAEAAGVRAVLDGVVVADATTTAGELAQLGLV